MRLICNPINVCSGILWGTKRQNCCTCTWTRTLWRRDSPAWSDTQKMTKCSLVYTHTHTHTHTHTKLIKTTRVLQTDVIELVILEWNHRDWKCTCRKLSLHLLSLSLFHLDVCKCAASIPVHLSSHPPDSFHSSAHESCMSSLPPSVQPVCLSAGCQLSLSNHQSSLSRSIASPCGDRTY